MTLVPFTYTNGPAGFVKPEALKAFQRKDAAIVAGRLLRTGPALPAAEAVDAADKVFAEVQAANRAIKRGGWFFHSAQA